MTHSGHPLVGWKNHGWVLSVVFGERGPESRAISKGE